MRYVFENYTTMHAVPMIDVIELEIDETAFENLKTSVKTLKTDIKVINLNPKALPDAEIDNFVSMDLRFSHSAVRLIITTNEGYNHIREQFLYTHEYK